MKLRKIAAICGITACVVIAGSGCNSGGKGKSESKEAGQETSSTSSTEVAQGDVDYGKVTLGEYKGLKLEVTDTNVTDSEVESRIQSAVAANPNRTEVSDRAVASGDMVNIDFEGKIDGNPFDGGTSKGYELSIGSGSFIPGFEDQIIGMNKGETRDLNVTFPTPYENNPDLAGKEAVFTVTVNEIYQESPAEFNNAWVEKVSGGSQKTVEEYRESTRTELSKYKKESSETEAQLAAVDMVIKNSKFELSETGVNKELEDMRKQYEQMATSYGIDLQKFAEMSNMTMEEFEAKLKEGAESRAKQKLVISEIFNKEKMSLEDADYAKLEELSGMKKSDLVLQYGQDFIDENVKSLKVQKFLVDNAVKTTKAVETTAAPVTSVQDNETVQESSSN